MAPTSRKRKPACTADFSRSVDKDGTVIHFSVRGRSMLFNGHAGKFYDSLPRWAEAELLEAAQDGSTQAPRSHGVRGTKGAGASAFRRELRLFRTGLHPSLAPEERQGAFERRGQPRVINVFAGQACNLGCRYCVNRQGTFGGAPSVMSQETAQKVLRFIRGVWEARADGRMSVNILGGETLLAGDAVYALVRGLQDLNHASASNEIRVVLITNGTIYNSKVFEVLAERPDLCAVAVSLDAFQAAHDLNRPFANSGRGSYATVLGTIERMASERIPFSVTCVIPYPYDYIGAAEELHRAGITNLELKDLIDYVYGGSAVPEDCTGRLATWRANYLAYTDYFIEYLHSKSPARHGDRNALVKYYGGVFNPRVGFYRTLACGIGDEKLGIGADGAIVPCELLLGHADFAVGNVRDGFDPGRMQRFERQVLDQGQFRTDHEKCRRCFAKLICGGGCYTQSYDATGRFDPCEERTCELIREKARIDLYFLARLKDEHPATFAEWGGILD